MMPRRATLAALLLSACATTRPEPSPAEPTTPVASHSTTAAESPAPARAGVRRQPTQEEHLAIRQLLARTERIRELRFRGDVQVVVEDEASIVAALTDDVEEADLLEGQTLYTALGLLPEGLALLDLLQGVLGEQVVGFYDPKEARLVVRDDVMRRLGNGGAAFDEARIVIVHEMVHALQDQVLGLGRSFEAERDTDPENAFRAVVEGDATLAMLGYVIDERGGQLSAVTNNLALLEAMTNGGTSPVGGDALSRAPAIVRVGLVAPYIDGLRFAAELHARGGWEQIDHAHSRLPISTEQVMHPHRFRAGEMPETIELPPLPSLEQAGYRATMDDTLGELELGVFLGQDEEDGVNDVAAEGWGGDRVRLYQHASERPAIVWFTSWDTQRDAVEAESAALASLQRVAERDRGRHLVKRIGRGLLVVRWLAPTLQGSVVEAFGRFASALPERRGSTR